MKHDKLIYVLCAWCVVLTLYAAGLTIYLFAHNPRESAETSAHIADLEIKKSVGEAKAVFGNFVDMSVQRMVSAAEKQVTKINETGSTQLTKLNSRFDLNK